MKQVFKLRKKDGLDDRLEPYRYSCGNFMRADSTRSTASLTPEPTLESLAAWIEARQAAGESGGLRMKSRLTPKGGLFSISGIEVR